MHKLLKKNILLTIKINENHPGNAKYKRGLHPDFNRRLPGKQYFYRNQIGLYRV